MTQVAAETKPSTTTNQRVVQPRFDLFESKAGFQIEVELPGVKHADLTATLENNLLKIAGTRYTDNINGSKNEIIYSQTIRVPDSVETSQIDIELKQGLLTVTLPNRQKPVAQQIPVKNAV